MNEVSVSIKSPIIGAIMSMLGFFGSVTIGDISQIVAISAGCIGIIAGLLSIVIAREKYLALRQHRKFDEMKCKSMCKDPNCSSGICRFKCMLFNKTKED